MAENDMQLKATLLNSSSDEEKLSAVLYFRKLLDRTDEISSLNEVIRRILSISITNDNNNVENIVGKFISFLKEEYDVFRPLQFETLWTLTNIVSGESEFVDIVVGFGILPDILRLCLCCENVNGMIGSEREVAEQAIWCLGNIAGDGIPMRNYVIEAGGVALSVKLADQYLQLLKFYEENDNSILKEQTLVMLRNSVFLMSNLCRGKPAVKYSTVGRYVIQSFSKILQQTDDTQTLTDVCWGIAYLTDTARSTRDGEEEVYPMFLKEFYDFQTLILCEQKRLKKQILNPQVMRNIAKFSLQLKHPFTVTALINEKFIIDKLMAFFIPSSTQSVLQIPALRAIGNIIVGNDYQTQKMLDHPQLLSSLFDIIFTDDGARKSTSKKEAAWILSNIAAGSKKQIQTLLDSGILSQFFQLMQDHLQNINDNINNNFVKHKWDLQKEVCYVIVNSFTGGNEEQIQFAIDHKFFEIFVGYMEFYQKFKSNPENDMIALPFLDEIICTFLESIYKLMEKSRYHNLDLFTKLCNKLKESKCVDWLNATTFPIFKERNYEMGKNMLLDLLIRSHIMTNM